MLIHDAPPPEYLYKIVSAEAWEKSSGQKDLVLSPMDDSFIHLATAEQVPRVLQKFWRDDEYVVLRVATSKMAGRLIYERNEGGQNRYYHLYEGRIPLEAVVDREGKGS